MSEPEQKPPDTGLRLDTDKWNLLYGDPTQKDGYFIGGAGQEGARWATSGGGFTGDIGQKGLQSHIGLGGDMSLQLNGDFNQQMLKMGLNSGSTELFNGFGKVKDADNWEAGLGGSYGLPGGLHLDPSLSYLNNGDNQSGRFGLGATFGDNKFNGSYTLGDTNQLNLGLVSGLGGGYTGTRSMGMDFGAGTATNGYSIAGNGNTAGWSQKLGPDGESNTLSFGRNYGTGSFNGSVTGGDAVSGFTLGAAQTLPGGGGSLSERFGMNWGPDGAPTTTFGFGSNLNLAEGFKMGSSLDGTLGPAGAWDINGKFNESFRSNPFAQSLSLGGGSNSVNGEAFNATGSMTGMFGQTGLYGTGYGSYADKSNGDPSWFAGGGLTYMPTNQLGITAAGGYGSDGWETRLQADYFKKPVTGAGSLEDQRGHAAVSGYLGLSQGAGGTHMNDMFGKGQLDHGFESQTGPMVTLGIGVGF